MEARTFIAGKIREFRTAKLGISAATLGSLLVPERSGKTISSWERERTQPDADTMTQLCRIFDEPISAFYPQECSKTSDGGNGYYAEVALYGSIAAGKPLAILSCEDSRTIPIEMHRRFPQGFLLKVEGESMNNVLPNGAYAFIDPKQRKPIDNGVYAFCLNQDDATIKRVRNLENGYELVPDSKDPTFKAIVFDKDNTDADEITIIGRVVWMMLPFDWDI